MIFPLTRMKTPFLSSDFQIFFVSLRIGRLRRFFPGLSAPADVNVPEFLLDKLALPPSDAEACYAVTFLRDLLLVSRGLEELERSTKGNEARVLDFPDDLRA